MKKRNLFLFAILLAVMPAMLGCGSKNTKPTVAFVTNQIAEFWNIAKAGAEDAEKEFGVNVEVRMPSEGNAVVQKSVLEDLMNSNVDGIAVSPVDAGNQRDLLNSIAGKIPLITHDSDAPKSDRLMYIGMDNYLAGRKCGELIKEALPDGGSVMLFIGRLEQDNSKHRRQGVIDELLDRERDMSRNDPQEGEIKGEKYTILGTLTDQGVPSACKQKAEDALNTYEIDAVVGLFEYNPPALYEALKQAGKLGEIQLIGFDENDVTLQAIKDGECIGTVVQNPYEYGYQSVKVLASLVKGDDSVIPESKFIDIPARKITKENVDKYWADLRAKKAG